VGVDEVVLAHFQYIEAAAAFLEGSGPEPELSSADECLMGKWLAEHPDERMVELHERFHELIRQAVDAGKRGDKEAARMLLDQAYTLYAQLEHGLFA